MHGNMNVMCYSVFTRILVQRFLYAMYEKVQF